MNKTQIEWAKNPDGTPGYTWNPITGCLNGCEYCYARKLANTRLKERYLANKNVVNLSDSLKIESVMGVESLTKLQTLEAVGKLLYDPFYPRFWEDRMNLRPLVKSKPKGIFVCDMSDLFGICIPEEWTQRVLNIIQALPTHRFYLLTKQPQNLQKFSPFPDNACVGVSMTNSLQSGLDRGYPQFALAEIEAKVKFISFEPLLEHVHTEASLVVDGKKVIDWVIIGAQTKPTVMPKIEWVREIVEACDKAGIPVFLKNNLAPLLEEEPMDPAFWADIVNDERGHERVTDDLRQEMPQAKSIGV